MNDALRNLATAILLRTNRVSSSTLVKLVYLVDYEYAKDAGEPFTGTTYRFLKHGPFAQEILDTVSNPEWGFGAFKQISKRGKESAVHFLLRSGNVSRAALPSQVQKILDRILQEIDYKDTEDLLDYVYSTSPMQKARQGEILVLS